MPTIKGILRMLRLKQQTEEVKNSRPTQKADEDQRGVTVKFHYEENPDGGLELIQDKPQK